MRGGRALFTAVLFLLRVTSLKTIILRDGLSQQISTKKFETLSKSQIVSMWGTDIFPRFADPYSESLASVEDQKITDKKYAKNISSRPQVVPSLNLLGGLQDAFKTVSRVIVPKDSFGSAVNSPAFVDKTLFIKYFMTETNHTLVLAPNSFGKSTVLSMLRDFLEMPVDALGNVLDKRTSPNYKTFHRLNIYREAPTFFQEHFANYMVLKMDFADIKMQSLREFVHSFRRMVNRLFSEHPYLLHSPKLRRSDHEKFEKYSFPRCQMSHKDLASGGRVLSQLLFKHFRKQSILLVDNVDAPAASLALCQDTSNVAHILTVISKFIAKLLRNNHQVYRALFTGVLSVADVYTQEADTLDHRPVFGDARIGPYFGLTDHEVRELMVKSIRHDKLDEARRMFGGYKIKDSRETLFNTKSVTKFAAGGEYSRGIKTPPYLLELKPIFEYDIFGKVIEDSLEGETPVTLRLQFKEKYLYMLKPLLDANLLKKQSKDHLLGLQYKLFQYLLEYGYYTVRDYVSNNAVRVIVPNLEMKSELKRLIYTRKFFVDKFRIEESTLADYLMAIDMLTKNRTSFETLCASVAGIFAHNMPERSFEVQGPLLAYPALCPGAFEEVYSELHSERDRPADVFIRRNDGAAIVIGLTLDGDPFESLKRIVGRGYYKERVERSRRKIYIGVNVDRNNRCLISYLWNSEDLANAENVSFTANVRGT